MNNIEFIKVYKFNEDLMNKFLISSTGNYDINIDIKDLYHKQFGLPNLHTISFVNNKECPLLDYIKSNIKTVEGRKYSSRYHNIRSNDYIRFVTKNEYDVYVKVIYVNKYKTLKDYLIGETIEKTIPCVKTYDKAMEIYNKWSNIDDRNKLLRRYGYSFIGIGIEVCKKQDIPAHNLWG